MFSAIVSYLEVPHSKKKHIVILFHGVGFTRTQQALIQLMSGDLVVSTIELKRPIKDLLDRVTILKPDGILTEAAPEFLGAICELGYPTAIVNSSVYLPGFVNVSADEQSIAKIASDHFINSGFDHFAFIGDGLPYSQFREASFRKRLCLAGLERFSSYTIPPTHSCLDSIAGQRRDFSAWLKRQSKPLAILACHDQYANFACRIAQEAGFSIPEEVSIVGVGNDLFHCLSCDPHISSIPFPWTRICEEAGQLLIDVLDGAAPPSEIVTVPPLPIEMRQSSSVFAVEEPTTRRALVWLREHLKDPIDIGVLCQTLKLNRRTLEISFKKYLGKTPREELECLRVERSKFFLVNTDMVMNEIAAECGFSDASRLSIAFKRVEKISPSEYRKKIGG